jgi:general secretion pathway protein I
MKPERRQGGFTLVEVMVALAVVAIALPALVMAQYQQVDATAYLRDKSLASIVASNKLEELRLVTSARLELLSGETSGETTLAERDWFWSITAEKTELPKFFRMEIQVSLDEESSDFPLYTLVAFMRTDLAGPGGIGGQG